MNFVHNMITSESCVAVDREIMLVGLAGLAWWTAWAGGRRAGRLETGELLHDMFLAFKGRPQRTAMFPDECWNGTLQEFFNDLAFCCRRRQQIERQEHHPRA